VLDNAEIKGLRTRLVCLLPDLSVKLGLFPPHHKGKKFKLVCEMFIEGGPAHHGPVAQLIYGNVLKFFLTKHLPEGIRERLMGLDDPQVSFLLHKLLLFGNTQRGTVN
jgi:hypothetical protein